MSKPLNERELEMLLALGRSIEAGSLSDYVGEADRDLIGRSVFTIRELWASLDKYGVHYDSCPHLMHNVVPADVPEGTPCDCGLDAALASGGKADSSQPSAVSNHPVGGIKNPTDVIKACKLAKHALELIDPDLEHGITDDAINAIDDAIAPAAPPEACSPKPEAASAVEAAGEEPTAANSKPEGEIINPPESSEPKPWSDRKCLGCGGPVRRRRGPARYCLACASKRDQYPATCTCSMRRAWKIRGPHHSSNCAIYNLADLKPAAEPAGPVITADEAQVIVANVRAEMEADGELTPAAAEPAGVSPRAATALDPNAWLCDCGYYSYADHDVCSKCGERRKKLR